MNECFTFGEEQVEVHESPRHAAQDQQKSVAHRRHLGSQVDDHLHWRHIHQVAPSQPVSRGLETTHTTNTTQLDLGLISTQTKISTEIAFSLSNICNGKLFVKRTPPCRRCACGRRVRCRPTLRCASRCSQCVDCSPPVDERKTFSLTTISAIKTPSRRKGQSRKIRAAGSELLLVWWRIPFPKVQWKYYPVHYCRQALSWTVLRNLRPV